MRKLQGQGWWLALAVAVLIGWSTVRGGHPTGSAASSAGAPTATPSLSSGPASMPSSNGKPSPSATTAQDPAAFAAQVRTYARQAGIDPQLLMAILYNESYKPHDPAFERAWQRLHPDAAFGIANMHKAAFDEAKQGRTFASRSWQELPDDPALAVEAAAWYLHDLAARLPAHWPGSHTKDELLALGYNTGPANMLAFARGVQPGAQAQSYLDRLHDNWATAAQALRTAD